MREGSRCSGTRSRLVTSPRLDQIDVSGKITGSINSVRSIMLPSYTYLLLFMLTNGDQKKETHYLCLYWFKVKNICIQLYTILFFK